MRKNRIDFAFSCPVGEAPQPIISRFNDGDCEIQNCDSRLVCVLDVELSGMLSSSLSVSTPTLSSDIPVQYGCFFLLLSMKIK